MFSSTPLYQVAAIRWPSCPCRKRISAPSHATSRFDFEKYHCSIQVHILSYCSPEVLVDFGQTSKQSAELASMPSLWAAHCMYFLTWLSDSNLLPPLLGYQFHDFDTTAKLHTYDFRPRHFFTLRLGWRELVIRCAMHSGAIFGPSLMVVVNGAIYDLTDFGSQHPGSPEILRTVAGCDATLRFDRARHSAFAGAMMDEFEVKESKRAIAGRCFVPKATHDTWKNTPSCLQRRHHVNTRDDSCYRSCQDFLNCPHCHGLCREAQMFAEWMGIRKHLRDTCREGVYWMGEEDDENDFVEILSRVPCWDEKATTVDSINRRRELRENLRRRRGEQQFGLTAANKGRLVSSAPPGTLLH